jgi:hypothetical protein
MPSRGHGVFTPTSKLKQQSALAHPLRPVAATAITGIVKINAAN